jgi:5-hydroxyisourate hydrolase
VISTHILDTERGAPAAGVTVGLFRGSELISERETDEDGRITELGEESLEPGEYRVVFYVEGPFFRKVELTIAIPDPTAHYHVPLLVSPFSCVSYRGS